VLAAEFTKNRCEAVQPISTELADALRPFLAACPKLLPVWPGTWHEKGAKMLRIDLEAACIPFTILGHEGEETRDFHAFRNCYISNVIRAGADLKQAMTLARHSDPKLTTARYARTRLHDLGSLVNRLPSSKEPQTARLRMTGTDGEGTFREQQWEQQRAATGAANGGNGRLRLRTIEEGDAEESTGKGVPKNLKPLGNEEVSERAISDEDGTVRLPPPGFEPGTPGLGNRCSIP